MASAWGQSWGPAWGAAWGLTGLPGPPPLLPRGGLWRGRVPLKRRAWLSGDAGLSVTAHGALQGTITVYATAPWFPPLAAGALAGLGEVQSDAFFSDFFANGLIAGGMAAAVRHGRSIQVQGRIEENDEWLFLLLAT